MVGVRTKEEHADHGFTLIEVLVAIVLVGILSAVAVVGITNLTSKGSAAACAHSADAARAGSIVYFTATLAYPTTLLQMTTLTPPALTLPSGVTLNSAAVGSIPAGSIATASNWTLTISPGTAGGAPTFTCSSPAPGSSTSAAATVASTAALSATGTPACPGSFVNWIGEYYSSNDLSGSATLCRDDRDINFDWGYGSPSSVLPSDNFSARWTRSVNFSAGQHTFTVGSDDGSRLYIDGALIIDYWNDHAYGTQTATATLSGGAHTVVLEFYERGGIAQATLVWT